MIRPEAAAYIEKARQSLSEARIVAANELPDSAGRAASLAAFHSAPAHLFEITGKIAKTHNGVRAEFARVAQAEPRIERGFTTFLARGYSLEANADYAIGHEAGITIAEAEQAIEIATRFAESVSRLLEVKT